MEDGRWSTGRGQEGLKKEGLERDRARGPRAQACPRPCPPWRSSRLTNVLHALRLCPPIVRPLTSHCPSLAPPIVRPLPVPCPSLALPMSVPCPSLARPLSVPLSYTRGLGRCDTCVRTYFRTTGTCPVCATPLKASEFFTQTFEDVTVEKEVRIRKQMLRVYVTQPLAGPRPPAGCVLTLASDGATASTSARRTLRPRASTTTTWRWSRTSVRARRLGPTLAQPPGADARPAAFGPSTDGGPASRTGLRD